MRHLTASFLVIASLIALSAPAAAQLKGSIGVGAVGASGDLEDIADYGATLRGQIGTSIPVFDIHAQVGVTYLQSGLGTLLENSGIPVDTDDFTFYHVGAGARLPIGPVFLGANALFFGGDTEEGLAFVPEIGFYIWKLEAVADMRVEEEVRWISGRIGWVF